MKKIVLFSAFVFVAITSCGPAAEDRQMMHSRAKVFQDSIANMIRTTMAEAEAPGAVQVQTAPVTPPAATPAAQQQPAKK